MARLTSKILFLPNRSPRGPVTTIDAARNAKKQSIMRLLSAKETPKSSEMVGSAGSDRSVVRGVVRPSIATKAFTLALLAPNVVLSMSASPLVGSPRATRRSRRVALAAQAAQAPGTRANRHAAIRAGTGIRRELSPAARAPRRSSLTEPALKASSASRALIAHRNHRFNAVEAPKDLSIDRSEGCPGGLGRDLPHSGHGPSASSTAAPQKGHRPFGR